jgi:DNA-binding transcriptional ArsR family regulator
MAANKADMPEARRDQILTWLQQEEVLSIRELQHRLGVSHMTVHRDLSKMAEKHLVQKVRGGVILVPAQIAKPQQPICAMCTGRVDNRSEFVILRRDKLQLNACCPHCGILLLSENEEAESILARDYLHGRMVNAYQAYYVVDSDIRLCCVPGTLCFTNKSEAEKFQRGFGGLVMAFIQTLHHLTATHKHSHR